MDFSYLMNYLSWEIYTRFFFALQDNGVYFIPLLIFLYSGYIRLLTHDANTSISAVSIKNILYSVLIYVFIFVIAVMPVMKFELIDQTKNNIYQPSANTNTKNTDLNKIALETSNTLKENSTVDASIPIVFGLFEVGSHLIIGGTQKALSQLNINDIRSQITTTMQNNAIRTPALKRFYDDFVNQCFNPARNKFDQMVDKKYITTDNFWTADIDQEEYDWAGGSYYLKTKGFYKPCPSEKCQPNDVIASPGVSFLKNNTLVSCDVVWKNELKPALIKEFKIDQAFSDKDKTLGKYNIQKLKEYAIRGYLKAEDTVADEEGGGLGIVSALKEVVSWFVGLIGSGLITFVKIITTYLVTVIIPMIQALLLFVIIIMLPILLPLSAFRLEYLFSIFAALFAISFVSIIIAVISIVDNSLLSLMASNSPSDNSFMQAVHIAGSGNGLSFFLINLLILFFYLIAIKLWFEFMSEFGGRVIEAIGREAIGIRDMGITDAVKKINFN